MSNILLHPHDHKNHWDWRVVLSFLEKVNIKPQSVLELGGGLGNIAYFYARQGAKATIEDINPDYLKRAVERHSNIDILVHDINKPLPFADNSFDLVCCTGTLHYGYVLDVEAVLREMKRVSKKYIFVDLFSAGGLYKKFEKIIHPNHNPRRFLPAEARALFAKVGLTLIKISSTRNLPVLSRLAPFNGKAVLFLLEKVGGCFDDKENLRIHNKFFSRMPRNLIIPIK